MALYTERVLIVAALLLSGCISSVSANGPLTPSPALLATVENSSWAKDASFDDAARKASIGAFEDAYHALESRNDSLRAGILASLCGMHQEALELLRAPQRNSYLEKYRLYYLARSLSAQERYAEAFKTLRLASSMQEKSGKKGDRFGARKRELEAEILSASDSLLECNGLPEDVAMLSASARYSIARAFLRIGKDSLGHAELLSSLKSSWRADERSTFSEALSFADNFFEEATDSDLCQIAKNCLSLGLCDDAMHIVKHICKRLKCEDAETMLIKAQALYCKGRIAEAAQIYEKVLVSDGDSRFVKEAARKLASCRYTLGQYDRAVFLCHSFAASFPEDPERYRMLALAGRIEIERGNLETAYETFYKLVERKVVELENGSGIEYISVASALSCILGRTDEMNRKFAEIAKALDSNGASNKQRRALPAALLYWLWRTAYDDSIRSGALAALESDYPGSHYTFAARGKLDSLALIARNAITEDRISVSINARRRFLDSLVAIQRAYRSTAESEVLEASRYFMDCGLVSEARECIEELLSNPNETMGTVLSIYREAIDRDLYSLALKTIAAKPFLLEPSLRENLSYPVAYPDIMLRGATFGLSPQLLLAVAREESMFDPRARSKAGAIGLMQIMPETARWLARKYGWAGARCIDLEDPMCNVAIGSEYLAYLIEKFDGSLVVALAAYNGGEGKTADWRKRFAALYDPMIAKELINLRETRFYVSKVLDSLCKYTTIIP